MPACKNTKTKSFFQFHVSEATDWHRSTPRNLHRSIETHFFHKRSLNQFGVRYTSPSRHKDMEPHLAKKLQSLPCLKKSGWRPKNRVSMVGPSKENTPQEQNQAFGKQEEFRMARKPAIITFNLIFPHKLTSLVFRKLKNAKKPSRCGLQSVPVRSFVLDGMESSPSRQNYDNKDQKRTKPCIGRRNLLYSNRKHHCADYNHNETRVAHEKKGSYILRKK